MGGALIIGTGPGIATSVARKFGIGGLSVGLIARRSESLEVARAKLATAGVERVVTARADASQEEQVKSAIEEVIDELGVPQVLVYNAGLIQLDRPGELDHEQHLMAYAVNVLGALTAAAHVAPRMAEAGGGTMIFTGGMPEPVPSLVSLSLGKAGVRALTTLLAHEYGRDGIHVATVTVCGAVEPGGAFDPDRIAEHYWRLHQQPRDHWELEVMFTGESAGASIVDKRTSAS